MTRGEGGVAPSRYPQARTALTALAGRHRVDTTAIRASASPVPAHLASALARHTEASHEFASGLQDWLAHTQALLSADRTANQVTGPVTGTVIQARDISGGVSLGSLPGPPA